MARRNSAVEVNRHVKGIITEASPLTYPENASVDERNFVLNKDGSRQRRLGMDLEENYTLVPIDSYEESSTVAFSSFRWGNLGNRLSEQLAVVQSGKRLDFFDLSEAPVSDNRIFNYTIEDARPDEKMSFASVGSRLVVASGSQNIHIFSYKNGTVTVETDRLKIRDLFGVEDPFPAASGPDQIDMRQGSNISFRPEIELSDNHLYNLRNQTWAHMMRIEDREYKDDPIFWFNLYTDFEKHPSNADSLLTGVAPLNDDADDRVGDRFHPKAVVDGLTGNFQAPMGYFIIDALNRGNSRLEEVAKHKERNAGEGQGVMNPVRNIPGSLPVDRSDKGATVVASFAGRVFYSGFDGRVTGGDRHSPEMESMVMFSQLIKDPEQVVQCYQQGDPTYKDNPDLLDTDGGFIPINGARKIKKMIEFDRYLVIFAENGVWSVTGGSDYGFTATDYRVDKITSFGVAGADTVVAAGDTLFYWSHDGIYVIQGDQTGRLNSQNITINTIQTLFDSTNSRQRELCKGEYETARSRVRWLVFDWDSSFNIIQSYELVFDMSLEAFYLLELNTTVGYSAGGIGPVESQGDSLEIEVIPESGGDNVTVTAFPSDVKPISNTEVFDSNGNVVTDTADILGYAEVSPVPGVPSSVDGNVDNTAWNIIQREGDFSSDTIESITSWSPFTFDISFSLEINLDADGGSDYQPNSIFRWSVAIDYDDGTTERIDHFIDPDSPTQTYTFTISASRNKVDGLSIVNNYSKSDEVVAGGSFQIAGISSL